MLSALYEPLLMDVDVRMDVDVDVDAGKGGDEWMEGRKEGDACSPPSLSPFPRGLGFGE